MTIFRKVLEGPGRLRKVLDLVPCVSHQRFSSLTLSPSHGLTVSPSVIFLPIAPAYTGTSPSIPYSSVVPDAFFQTPAPTASLPQPSLPDSKVWPNRKSFRDYPDRSASPVCRPARLPSRGFAP